jgi:hypothetical protein
MKKEIGAVFRKNEKGFVEIIWEEPVADYDKCEILLALFRGEYDDIIKHHKCNEPNCLLIETAKRYLEVINYEFNSLRYKINK